MNDNHKLSKKDIAIESLNILKELAMTVGECVFGLSVFPYILPTSTRLIWAEKHPSEEPFFKSSADKSGYYFGCTLGIVSDFAQGGAYYYFLKNSHPEILLIPLTTNVLSGTYELGRLLLKNAEKRLTDRKNNLEEKIEK